MFVSDVSDFKFVGKVKPAFFIAKEEVLRSLINVDPYFVDGYALRITELLNKEDMTWRDGPDLPHFKEVGWHSSDPVFRPLVVHIDASMSLICGGARRSTKVSINKCWIYFWTNSTTVEVASMNGIFMVVLR